MSKEAPACRADPGAMPRAVGYIESVQVGVPSPVAVILDILSSDELLFYAPSQHEMQVR
jgi:hypothetical protein